MSQNVQNLGPNISAAQIVQNDQNIDTDLQASKASLNTTITNHTSATAGAHPAAAITSTRLGNAQSELTDLDQRVNNIVANSGSGNTEIVAARRSGVSGTTYATLGARMDANDTTVNTNSAAIAGNVQESINSGVTRLGAITAGLTANLNAFKFAKDNAMVNGVKIALTNLGGMVDGTNLVQLNAPQATNFTPAQPGSAGDTLVFEEFWLDAGGAGWKTRIRTVDGVDFGTYPEGIADMHGGGNTAVAPQGGLSSPLIGSNSDNIHRFRWTGYTGVFSNLDNGLYIAGDGSTSAQTTLNTLDGYVYAIPLFRVRRRNSAAFDPDNNPLGGAQYGAYTDTHSAQTILPGQSGQLIFNTSSITWQVGQSIYVTNNSNYRATVTGISTVGSTTTVTVTAITAFGSGGNWANVSDRPDGLYSNIIDASDIVDLRHQVSLTGFNYQSLLEQNLDLLLRGKLTTNQQTRYGRDYIGLNTSAYTDDVNSLLYLKFDGNINGTANGATVTGTQTGTVSFGNGVQGLAAQWTSVSQNTNYASWVPPTLPTEAQGSIEFLIKNVNGSLFSPNANQYCHIADLTGTGISIQTNGQGNQVRVYDSNGAQYQSVTVPNDGSWHFVKYTWNSTTGDSLALDTNTPLTFAHMTWLGSCTGVSMGAGGNNYGFVGALDLLRISNIVRTGTPLPTGFSYANGDRILDGPNGDFSFYSDDVGGTTGVNGRTNPYGLSRVQNQMAGRISYNGSEIRHYYGQGITAGYTSASSSGTQPTGSFDYSAEFIKVTANEASGGTTYTFTKPSNAPSGALPVALFGNFSVAPNSASIDANGTVTATYGSAQGTVPTLNYILVQRHAHFIPSTKGFIIHDWTDDPTSGTGSQTVFQTTKYNVTSVNHVRVAGAIQNGGYTVTGLTSRTTVTTQAAAGATTLALTAASTFVNGQNVRVQTTTPGQWYTTTVTSGGGTTSLTIPATVGVTIPANAVIEGAAVVTFTAAPATGTNNIDLVYESVLTPNLGDYIRIHYQHTPYQGLLGTSFAGSGVYRVMYASPNSGFITTIGTGSNSTPNVPAWMKDYPVPSSQLPINGNDYTLKHDVITLTGATATGASQQFAMNEQIYEYNQINALNMYSPLTLIQPVTATSRGCNSDNGSDGVTGRLIGVALRDLTASIPHLMGLPLLVQDTATGEMLLLVKTTLATSSTNATVGSGTASSIDVFKLPGRPLIKGYGGVAA